MHPLVLLLCLLMLIGSGSAADVPFVFGENSSNLAGYSSAQLEKASSSSPDLAGIPLVTSPSDSEVLEIPITGGGSTPEGKLEKEVADLKDELNEKVEPSNPMVREDAEIAASKYPGDLRIDQICEIYYFLKYGDNTKSGWKYVRDPRGIDSWNYANASLKIGERINCVGLGDCDDFAILMAAFIESIGGATRIILANNNSTGGHAYAEVYLGQLNDPKCQVEDIIEWLQQDSNISKIYGHIDTDTKEVWLNMDWGPDEKGNAHPGGPLFQGSRHFVLRIRDRYKLIPLRMHEAINRAPRLIGLTSDRKSPQEAGAVVIWTAEAEDFDNDQILYRFFLNGYPVTKWTSDNSWAWATTKADTGDNKVEADVRDGKHAGPNRFDSCKVADFSITAIAVSQVQETQGPEVSGPQDVADQYKKDNALVSQRKYDETIQAYDEAIRLNPNNASAWNGKGDALRRQDKYDEAIRAYDEAIRLDPKYVRPWNNKGMVLVLQDKCDEAIRSFENAIKLDPQNTTAWIGKGIALFEQKKFGEAIQAFEYVIGLDPQNSMAWYSKGLALLRLGRNGEALQAFDEATQHRDGAIKESDLWNLKGLAYNGLGKFDEALQAYDRATESDPQFAAVWSNKANTLLNLGRNDEALQASEKAVELNPNNTMAWSNKGRALFNLGRYNEAIQAYDEAIRINPRDAAAWRHEGDVLWIQGKNDEAIRAYDAAIGLDPKYVLAWNGKGNALAAQGRYDEAIEAYDEAIRLDPTDVNAWNGRGNVLCDQGKYNEAMRAYDEAIRLNPNYSQAWNGKGTVLKLLVRYDEAIQAYDQAIRIDPKFAVFWNNRGNALNAVGRTSEASSAFAKARELGYSG